MTTHITAPNNRAFEITETATGWKLTLFENGEEAGGGVGGPDDYDFLLTQGEDFAYTDL